MWQHLIETALLGTEKRPVNPELLPVEIRDILAQANVTPEQSFLEAAALCHFYLESGQYPAQYNGELDQKVIDETLPVAPSPVNDIFNHLDKANSRFKEKLYNVWLDLLIRKQYIVAPEILVQLLLVGNNFSDTTKAKILKVVGNKGNWILSQHSGLQYNQILRDDVVWTEGNASERKVLLGKLLKTDPDNALTLLKTTWAQEPLVNKRVFLDLLKEFSTPGISEFAQTLYEGEFSYHAKEKKTEKECRRILAAIMLGSTETALHKQTLGALLSYLNVEKKKGLLSFVVSKNQTDYQLPEGGDVVFWNAETMEQKYGLETRNYDISLFNSIQQYWLSCFIETVPAEAWLTNSLSSHTDFLNCFLANENFSVKVAGKEQPVFLNAIFQNIQESGNSELALSLLARVAPTDALPLLKYIKPADFEQFVKKNKYYADAEILQAGPYDLEESWSLSFSEYILSNISEYATQPNAINLNAIGLVIAQFVNTDADQALQKYHDKVNGTNFFYQWNTCIYEPVDAVLRIRRLIKSSNN